MKTRKNLALWRSALVLVLTAAAVAFIGKTPALEAQGRSDLETRHQRLLPLFETAGVVFTDADETSGRLVVGVLNRGRGEGQVRARLRQLGIDSQDVDVVETEPIIALATLRDRSTSIVGGLQIRFSQFLCSLGFPAIDGNGVAGFVTASHCSDRQGSVDGTTYYQPLDQVANDLIGTEIADPPYVKGHGCTKGQALPNVGRQLQRLEWSAVSDARPDRANHRARLARDQCDESDVQHQRRGRGQRRRARQQSRTDDWLDSRPGQQHLREHRRLWLDDRAALSNVRDRQRRDRPGRRQRFTRLRRP